MSILPVVNGSVARADSRLIASGQSDGLTNQVHSNIVAPRLMSDDAQQVQRIGVLRLHREDLPVEHLRFRQSSNLMVLELKLKSLGDSHSLKTLLPVK